MHVHNFGGEVFSAGANGLHFSAFHFKGKGVVTQSHLCNTSKCMFVKSLAFIPNDRMHAGIATSPCLHTRVDLYAFAMSGPTRSSACEFKVHLPYNKTLAPGCYVQLSILECME